MNIEVRIIQNQVIQRKLQMLLLNKQGYPQSQSMSHYKAKSIYCSRNASKVMKNYIQ